jgi:predicted transcriptional regulator
MQKEKNQDVRDEILLHLLQKERTLAWLCKKTKIPYPTLYSCLKQKNFNISDDTLKKINKALGTNLTNN